MDLVFWGIIAAIVIVVIGTARGFWLQGTKLDRFLDSAVVALKTR